MNCPLCNDTAKYEDGDGKIKRCPNKDCKPKESKLDINLDEVISPKNRLKFHWCLHIVDTKEINVLGLVKSIHDYIKVTMGANDPKELVRCYREKDATFSIEFHPDAPYLFVQQFTQVLKPEEYKIELKEMSNGPK